jgi:SNF2 family DNA or RNA helicase
VPKFDEATIRKASSWQDFKEAQALLRAGAVTESEETKDAWKGSVTIGKRVYRPVVQARTPTWFDAKCSCPANQREGSFCPHAIAVALHLLSPPTEEKVSETPKIAANPLPALAWKVRFLGPWQTLLKKSHATLSLEPGEHSPTAADARLTSWLLSHKATSSSSIKLALDPKSLPSFLHSIQDHPCVLADSSPIAVDSGAQIHLSDCTLRENFVILHPSADQLMRIGSELWRLAEGTLSKISSNKIPQELSSILDSIFIVKPAKLEISFFLQHLDTLQTIFDFSASSWFESLQFMPATPEIRLEIDGNRSRITAQLNLNYPDDRALPRLEGNTVITLQSHALAKAAALLSSHIHPRQVISSLGQLELKEPLAIQNFLSQTLGSLPSHWILSLSDSAKAVSESYLFVTHRIETTQEMTGETRFNLSFETNTGSVIPITEIRRLLRSKGSSQQLLGNKQIILSEDIEGLMDPLFEELDLHQENGSFIAKAASAEIIHEISKKYAKSLKNNEPENNQANDLYDLPTSIHASLRPYQMAGFSWINDRLKKYQGALLADDMGLGKTIQTIASIEYLFDQFEASAPALVVVTSSLLGNWQAEFARFAPTRKTVILHGTKRDKLRESIRAGDVILTTYSTLARDLAWHLSQDYLVCVIDEASLIRNPDTDHSKAVAKLHAQHRIALTGTPVENSARDLWSIFRFIQPGWLGTRKHFAERYEHPLLLPETAASTSQLLRLKTSPFTLRRTKQEVAPELPSKILIDEFCALSADQAATYRDIQREGQKRVDEILDSGQAAAARMATLTTLLRLRQACCDLALFDSEKLRSLPLARRSAKLERLLEIAQQSIASGSKILVFSQFQKQLIEIETQLKSLAIPSLRLDGQTRNRQELVDRFQSAEGPPIFLISLKAGGYGLNLTAADVVVHFDPWWNPAAEAQATDRAHRIGQSKPVTVFRLLTRNTVEEKVVELQSTKKALAESLDETITPSDAPSWSSADLERLLRSS